MNEQTGKTLHSSMNQGLQEVKLQAAKEIAAKGFTQEAALLLALVELIKEQTQNESTGTTTR